VSIDNTPDSSAAARALAGFRRRHARLCAACTQPFQGFGKAIYCSARCSNRVQQRRKRKKQRQAEQQATSTSEAT
jgi:hypothetical protein